MKAILNTKTLYEVFILNSDGQRIGPFRAAFPCDCEAIIYGEIEDVNEGYKLIKQLPDGEENIFTIYDINYDPGFYSTSVICFLKIHKDLSL